MSSQPTVATLRLVLRPFTANDAPTVQKLAGAPEVADTTLTIPHPYVDGMAETWIATHGPSWDAGTLATFAITLQSQLVGAVGLKVELPHGRGELGYWVGRPYWGQGIATEAAMAVIRLGFTTLALSRIQAMHLTRNPASGRVLQKAGMVLEAVHRGYIRKNGRLEDVARYAALRDEWLRIAGAA